MSNRETTSPLLAAYGKWLASEATLAANNSSTTTTDRQNVKALNTSDSAVWAVLHSQILSKFDVSALAKFTLDLVLSEREQGEHKDGRLIAAIIKLVCHLCDNDR